MKVAVLQVGYGDGEPFGERVERVAALVAAQRGCDLVILPELWAMTGFGYQQWEALAEPLPESSRAVGAESLLGARPAGGAGAENLPGARPAGGAGAESLPGAGPVLSAMAAAAASAQVLLHAGSIVERLATAGVDGNMLSNTSIVLSPSGELLTIYRKIHRFGFGAGEPKLMEAGVVDAFVGLPGGRRASLSTCYDLRFPELYRRQVEAGAQVFLVPAAWPAARVGHWSLLGRARAVENQCVLIACNTAGMHAGVQMGGRSQVVSARGEVLAEAGVEEEVLRVEIDLEETTRYRAEFPVLADRRL